MYLINLNIWIWIKISTWHKQSENISFKIYNFSSILKTEIFVSILPRIVISTWRDTNLWPSHVEPRQPCHRQHQWRHHQLQQQRHQHQQRRQSRQQKHHQLHHQSHPEMCSLNSNNSNNNNSSIFSSHQHLKINQVAIGWLDRYLNQSENQ